MIVIWTAIPCVFPVDNTPEVDQQHFVYENWLVKQGEYLEMRVKFIEQQIQKQKRTKKAINARNRQVGGIRHHRLVVNIVKQ